MNCREAERLLDTFFDGELDGRLMRDAALHVTRCQSCERELQEKEGVKTLLSDTIRDDVGSVDLGSLWNGIEAEIQGERPGDATGEVGAEPAPAEAGRHGFGRRSGGRYGGASRRGAGRRGVGRASAAGVGAVAVGLAAFLVLNAGPERESEQLLATPASEMDEVVVSDTTSAESPPETKVARQEKAETEPAAETAVAAGTSPGRSPVETVALGPVGTFRPQDEPLSSEWSRQVQVGPVQYSDHAMSLWRDTAAR